MSQDPEPPKVFDRWMIAVLAASSIFAIYGFMRMAGLV